MSPLLRALSGHSLGSVRRAVPEGALSSACFDACLASGYPPAGQQRLQWLAFPSSSLVAVHLNLLARPGQLIEQFVAARNHAAPVPSLCSSALCGAQPWRCLLIDENILT